MSARAIGRGTEVTKRSQYEDSVGVRNADNEAATVEGTRQSKKHFPVGENFTADKIHLSPSLDVTRAGQRLDDIADPDRLAGVADPAWRDHYGKLPDEVVHDFEGRAALTKNDAGADDKSPRGRAKDIAHLAPGRKVRGKIHVPWVQTAEVHHTLNARALRRPGETSRVGAVSLGKPVAGGHGVDEVVRGCHPLQRPSDPRSLVEVDGDSLYRSPFRHSGDVAGEATNPRPSPPR